MANCPKTGEECPALTAIEDGIAQGSNLCASESARVAIMQFSVSVLESGDCEGLKPYVDDEAHLDYDGEVFFGVECGSSQAEILLEVVSIASDTDIEGSNYTEEVISASDNNNY